MERTFDQDPQLPFRLLVDIALRAMFPAVNDPATAVDCMDRMEDMLARLAGRDLDIGYFPDEKGELRVTIPVPRWDQYIRTALDDLLFAAASSPMALRAMHTAHQAAGTRSDRPSPSCETGCSGSNARAATPIR
ncbi:DUF2254 family protein [Streptomyces sp. NPDC091268]|uniref:DUF2254 family protein n=1 Tax=Streptomyces sp. NPDC091268 TaxID=3365979 RepID=UPI0037F557A6